MMSGMVDRRPIRLGDGRRKSPRFREYVNANAAAVNPSVGVRRRVRPADTAAYPASAARLLTRWRESSLATNVFPNAAYSG